MSRMRWRPRASSSARAAVRSTLQRTALHRSEPSAAKGLQAGAPKVTQIRLLPSANSKVAADCPADADSSAGAPARVTAAAGAADELAHSYDFFLSRTS
eukprot:264340-Pyramimonas_sp.AAC.1